MTQSNDLLYTFTGISGERIAAALREIINRRGEWQTMLVDRFNDHPLESLTGFLSSASLAFYLAERGVNPKIQPFVDSLYYISTCMSVGYADVFAQTQQGKLIATLAMTVGPNRLRSTARNCFWNGSRPFWPSYGKTGWTPQYNHNCPLKG